MNLQTYQPNLAVKSPCHDCSQLGANLYPTCAEVCDSVNSYLIFLGDRPHLKIAVDSRLVMPSKEARGQRTLCTKEEYASIVDYVRHAKDALKLRSLDIAAEVGCSIEHVNTILRTGKKQQMAIDTAKKFQAWIEKRGLQID